MNTARDPSPPKAVILGLDGLSWPLLRSLAEAGTMPRTARLLEEAAAAGPMNSVRPEISPVAWTSFFTAADPSDHGVYGFTDFQPGGYQVDFTSSGSVRAPCLWDWLSMRGRRSTVLNVPLTYPARPLEGRMVSGFVALDYRRAAWPPELAETLIRADYRLEADFEKAAQDRDSFLRDLSAALAGRRWLLEHFWPGDWDLFVLIVTDTDRLFHFYLGEYENRGAVTPYFLEFLKKVDDLVGEVADRTALLAREYGGPVGLFLLSDHGFTPVIEEFHLNRWLAREGFLTRPGPEALALALDPTRVYLNGPPRFSAGPIRPAERELLLARIEAALLKEKAVAGTDRGAELYRGRESALAPDLVAHPAPGYEFKAKFNAGLVYTPSPLQGTHTFENAFFLFRPLNSDNKPGRVRDILEFGQTVFDWFDLR